MANQQHLDLLKLGAATWNAWKATQPPDFVADLSDVFLENTVLAQCDLRNADFRATHFWRCSLIGADFHGADLRQAHFWQCSLTQANLSGANLSDAWFIRATLKDVNLNNATLTGADFIESTR